MPISSSLNGPVMAGQNMFDTPYWQLLMGSIHKHMSNLPTEQFILAPFGYRVDPYIGSTKFSAEPIGYMYGRNNIVELHVVTDGSEDVYTAKAKNAWLHPANDRYTARGITFYRPPKKYKVTELEKGDFALVFPGEIVISGMRNFHASFVHKMCIEVPTQHLTKPPTINVDYFI